MSRYKFLLLSILTGLLLSFGWPASGFPFLLLVAFVPLLFIEDTFFLNNKSTGRPAVFIYAYIAFFIWNTLTTWWIYYSTLPGAIMAIVFNSLFMALVFLFFHISRCHIYTKYFRNNNYGYLILISYWITFEYLHMDWDLTWSWLNLGNGFANYHTFIQWYEYTGVLGGTTWILLSNILIYQLIKSLTEAEKNRRKIVINFSSVFLVVFVPCFISLAMYFNYSEKSAPVEVVVIQPNIDPYNEKFSGMTAAEQIERIANLSTEKISPQTLFVVAPETAIPEGLWIDEVDYAPTVLRLKELITEHPQLSIVIGASTYKMYEDGEEKTATARKYPHYPGSYDIYNSAIFIDSTTHIQHYHKSKLVPGVEKMPYPTVFGFLEDLAINLGGMVGSHGTQKERSVFKSTSGINVAPVICYESIYGDYVSEYIRNGAQLIFIITNDGWWDNSPGHRQHNEYARLRAIETRRSIARSANTGISCFINQRGDMFQKTAWWTPTSIVQNINTNDTITFYAAVGDYIGRILAFLSLLIAILTIVNIILKRKRIIS